MQINKKALAYIGLIFVVLVWGLAPFFLRVLFKYFSPAINTASGSFIACICFAIISGKKLKLIDKSYLKIAIPLGVFYSLASVMQKVGLPYTTDTQYAFLENLSCVVVPVLVFFFTKKKPSVLTIFASVLCLISCFVLSGMDLSTGAMRFGIGELLCALAGVFYGVNIAGTGIFAKKLDTTVYLTIVMFIESVVSLITAISLNFITVGGKPIEPLIFNLNLESLAIKLGITLVSTVFCWALRVSAMKEVDATAVAVIMPMAALVTTLVSVISGAENVTLSLIIGATLGLVASVLSGFGDISSDKKLRKAMRNCDSKKTE